MGHRTLGALQAIMNFGFGSGDFLNDLGEWEAMVETYERTTNETISDSIKIVIVTSKAPKELKDFALAHVKPGTSYSVVKETMTSWTLFRTQ